MIRRQFLATLGLGLTGCCLHEEPKEEEMQEVYHSMLSCSPANRDVIWVIGDSLTRARESGAYGPTPTANTVFQYYGGTINQIGATDIQQDVDDVNWGSMWPKFGINYHSNTGRSPVFALSGKGGTTFSFDASATDTWSTASTLYADSKDFCDDACAAVGVAEPKYTIIHLGINDAFYSASLSNIATDVNSLFSRITTDYPNTIVMMVIIGRLASGSNNLRIASIRSYLVQAARDYTNVHIATSIATFASASTSYYLADNIHLNQTGNNKTADMLGNWISNQAYSKWGRSIISSHLTDLSSARKTLIDNFATTVGTSLFDMEVISNFKTVSSDDACFDWAFLYSGINLGSASFTANSHIATNGSSTYWRIVWQPSIAVRTSQNDIFAGFKIKDNRSTGFATAIGVGTGSSNIRIGQTSTPTAYGRINDVTSLTFTDTSFQDDNWYSATRTASNAKAIHKNATQNNTATTASISNSATGFLTVGAHNNNGSLSDYIDADFEAVLLGKPAARETVRAALETVLDNW